MIEKEEKEKIWQSKKSLHKSPYKIRFRSKKSTSDWWALTLFNNDFFNKLAVAYFFGPPRISGYITISSDITVITIEKLGLDNMGIAFGIFSHMPQNSRITLGAGTPLGIRRC